jgi:hypothetical protein
MDPKSITAISGAAGSNFAPEVDDEDKDLIFAPDDELAGNRAAEARPTPFEVRAVPCVGNTT